MRTFGLIGKKLSHSFSKQYFEAKFDREGIHGCRYELFEIDNVSMLPNLLTDHPEMVGFNVTIPYKMEILPYLNHLDKSALKVGAANVVKLIDGKLIGYNSDYYGFKQSLEKWIITPINKSLILGTGGASRAILAALYDLGITPTFASRVSSENQLDYTQLVKNAKLFQSFQLIVNCTPLGTYPDVDTCPDLPYDAIHPTQYFYDLVYNPAETLMMKLAIEKGAKVKNGLEMLELQAEKSWEIWNS